MNSFLCTVKLLSLSCRVQCLTENALNVVNHHPATIISDAVHLADNVLIGWSSVMSYYIFIANRPIYKVLSIPLFR